MPIRYILYWAANSSSCALTHLLKFIEVFLFRIFPICIFVWDINSKSSRFSHEFVAISAQRALVMMLSITVGHILNTFSVINSSTTRCDQWRFFFANHFWATRQANPVWESQFLTRFWPMLVTIRVHRILKNEQCSPGFATCVMILSLTFFASSYSIVFLAINASHLGWGLQNILDIIEQKTMESFKIWTFLLSVNTDEKKNRENENSWCLRHCIRQLAGKWRIFVGHFGQ